VGSVALYGVLFGFYAYATYDLTSHATLRNWTTTLTAADMAWGTVLSAAAAAIGAASDNGHHGGQLTRGAASPRPLQSTLGSDRNAALLWDPHR
jgi:hypothetical protein